MRTQLKQLKELKKYDDTHPKKKLPPKKPISKKKTKKSTQSKRKLQPGQNTLKFYFTEKEQRKQIQIKCYEESDLDWPLEFISKLKYHALDNDQQSDDLVIAHEIKKGYDELCQEIAVKKIEQLEDTIGF